MHRHLNKIHSLARNRDDTGGGGKTFTFLCVHISKTLALGYHVAVSSVSNVSPKEYAAISSCKVFFVFCKA